MNPKLRVVVAGAVTALTVLCCVSQASAALTYVESPATVSNGGTSTAAMATCGGGSFVIGGGAFSTGGFGQVSIDASYPWNPNNWREITEVSTGMQSHRAYAICDDTEPVLRNGSDVAPAGAKRTVRADCPEHKNIYGGGYYSAGLAQSSRPFDDGDADNVRDDGWEATFYNNNNGSDSLDVYALCGRRSTGVKAKTRLLDSAEQGTVAATCPQGQGVTGGGARIAGGGWISSLYPDDSDDADDVPDDRWRVYLENTTAKQRVITAYVICG